MNPIAAALAIAVHAAVLVVVLPMGCASAEIKKPAPPPKGLEPNSPLFVRSVPGGTISCDKGYIGIGLKSSWVGLIYDVAPGSPAERAHIREGDIFVNRDDFFPDSVPIGTEVTVLITRGAVTTAKKLRVDRVCYR